MTNIADLYFNRINKGKSPAQVETCKTDLKPSAETGKIRTAIQMFSESERNSNEDVDLKRLSPLEREQRMRDEDRQSKQVLGNKKISNKQLLQLQSRMIDQLNRDSEVSNSDEKSSSKRVSASDKQKISFHGIWTSIEE